MDTLPLITVAICTYNRVDYLMRCLQSLQYQTVDKSHFDVLVVDNNSTDQTRKVVEAFNKIMPVRYHFEKKQGLSHARNTAIHHTKTSWVLYIDDEVMLPPDYLQKLLAILDETSCISIGGPVAPFYVDSGGSWADHYFDDKSYFGENPKILTDECLSGANLAFRTKWLKETDGFPPELGMNGESIAFAEDDYMQIQIRKKGGTIGYFPQLEVLHHITAQKQTLSWHLKAAFKRGFYAQKVTPESMLSVIAGVFRTLVAALLKHFPMNLWKMTKPSYRWQNLVVDSLGPFLYSSGKLKCYFSRS